MISRLLRIAAPIAFFVLAIPACAGDKPPAVGDEAKDFELDDVDGNKIKLSKFAGGKPVVLVVLRGNPGYQCPLCTKQVAELIAKGDDFAKAEAKVLLVYPGPAEKLIEKAKEFKKGVDYPKHFTMVTDPDYAFTKAYNLRWEAKNETAYPSTFVIDGTNKVTFVLVSDQHGGRAKTADVLKALAAK